MAKLQTGTRIYGTANVDTVLYVNSTAVVNTTGVYTTGLVNAASYNTGGGYGTATGGAIVNTTTIAVGNNTVNLFINSTSLSITVANAAALGGYTFAAPSTIGSTTANTGAFTTLSSANLTTSTNVVTIGTAAYHVSNGNFGIANTVPADKLAVAGTSYFNGNATFNGVATFYNINGQANVAAGAFVGNAYATLGGSSGNYLAFGQQTSSAQWIQSGYSSAGAPVYYSILLNPLGGNIGIGNAAPTDRLSVHGTSYLGNSVTILGNSTIVNVYSTGTINAAAVTIGTAFIVNTSQVTISSLPLSANGSVGTATYVLTSNGVTGSPYWAAPGGSGTFTGGTISGATTFSANATFNANVALTTPLIANGSPGTATHVLTSNGTTGSPFWAAGGGGGSFTNGSSISVSNLAFTNSGGGSVGVAYSFINTASGSLDTVFA